MKKLVIVSDDFGTLPSINDGILYLFQNGPVIEISMVTGAEYSGEAAEMAKKYKIPNIGVHIELLGSSKLGRPVTSQDYINLYQEKSYDEVENMASEELKKFEELLGRPPTHITSHKGIHGNFKLLNFIIKYAQDKKIPVRKPITAFEVELGNQNYAAEISLARAGIKFTDHLIAHMLGNESKAIKDAFVNDLKQVKDGESAEIVIHPSFFDQKLLEYSSLNYQRTRDIELITNKEFIGLIKNLGFEICSYKQL